MDGFDAKLVPCLMLFANGQPRFRQWGWDHDDVFDFMRTFDTMVLPVGYLFRNYYWLRSLYKFGIRSLLKTLKFDAEHPLQVWLPQLLAPLILLALMLLMLLARCFLACCRCCKSSKVTDVKGDKKNSPTGWRKRSSWAEKAEAEDGGHCMLLILVRHLTDENFTVAVVNTGDGLQYHPLRASGEAPSPELATRQCPLVLTDVPAKRITCGTFWYLLFRQFVRPQTSNGPQLLYSTLLPMLKKQPLAADFGVEPSGWVEFCPVPVRFCLRASGATEETAAWSQVRMAARFGEKFRSWELDAVRQLVQRVQDECWKRESSERDARTVLPPACPIQVVSGGRPAHELLFNDFERLLDTLALEFYEYW
ncbi:unnamed protein product, partial [Symbiodinium sp. CCMP2592]